MRQGLDDVAAGRETVPACLVLIAATRLRNAGLLAPGARLTHDEPERALYRMLRCDGGDAYSRYNALIRELVSFESALDARLRRMRERPHSP